MILDLCSVFGEWVIGFIAFYEASFIMAASCFSSHYILSCPLYTLKNFTLDLNSVFMRHILLCQVSLKCYSHKILHST